MSPALTRRLPWAIGALLVALLGVLAVLQLRWLDDVGDAERQRLEAGVETALASLSGELDREVSRAVLIFRPIPPGADPEATAAEQWRRWNELSPVPELVRDVEVVAAEDVPPFPELLPDLPGLSVPVGDGDRAGRMGRFRRRPEGEPDRPVRLERALRVSFDTGYLEAELLPSLVRRHLAPVLGDDADVRVTVERTGEVVYASSGEVDPGGGTGQAGRYEWRAPLFRLLPPDELVRLAFATGARDRLLDGEEGADERAGRRLPVPANPARHAFRGTHRAHHLGIMASLLEAPAGWTLEVRPAEGSLDASLARARRGNASVVFGILLLLVLAAIALALSARRAQEMARRQMEFTAAVSHELRTPLAAIRSLADNLADGVVREPEQARRYGTEIARQGERLTSMVEQVLALASQEGPRRLRETAPVDVAALVRSAVREATAAVDGPPAGSGGVDVEVDLADDLPPVTGDRALLERAVANLVGNAVKHGVPSRSGADGGRPWVGVRAARADGGGRPEVEIAVSDRGPGVPVLERERLFEPFFRGAGAKAKQLPGSGLGLHLVRRIAEAHGGRVEVGSPPGGGSRFCLRLPASEVPPDGREEAR